MRQRQQQQECDNTLEDVYKELKELQFVPHSAEKAIRVERLKAALQTESKL